MILVGPRGAENLVVKGARVVDPSEKLGWGKRLDEVVIRPGGEGANQIVFAAEGGQHDHGDGLAPVGVAYPTQQL